MSLLPNPTVTTTKSKNTKEKIIIGTSEAYIEPAANYEGLSATKWKALLLGESKQPNVKTVLQESNGKSLKLTLTITHNQDGVEVPEVQHVALITASDYSVSLDSSHVEKIKEHARSEPLVKRTPSESVVSMF